MEVKLIVVGGKRAGLEIPVPGPKFFVGRADDCQLRPQSDLVSRHHCAILLEDGFVLVRDFGSRNGTLVNGEAVVGEQELKAGDRLKIGPLELEVQIVVPLGAKKKPKVHNIHEAAARTVEGAVSNKEEEQIADWLGDDTAPPSRSLSDTQSISATQTTSFEATPPPAAPAPAAAANVPPPHTPAAKPPAKPAGKFEKKSSAKSSGAAADEVLRQFFGRKR
jgi:pSer/pThr/pTyr-binding forkhead associated (FHA) protein